MLYRILTELKNRQDVVEIVSRQFLGFSLIEAVGYWKRHSEPSLIVEVETEEQDKIMAVAQQIKNHNEQEAVLIQQIPNHAWLV